MNKQGNRSSQRSGFRFRGKQILLLGLVALVISAGYYRWTVERAELGAAVPTAAPAAEGSDRNEQKSDSGNENIDKNKTENGNNDKSSDEASEKNESMDKLRRDRDSARSSSVEEWRRIQSDEKNSQESRKDAENKIKQAAEASDAEKRVETQVKAKGYEDCYAYISENGISVTIKGGEIDGSSVASIKDIVVTETHIPVKNIKINQQRN